MAEGAPPRGAAALRVRQRFSGFYDLKVRQDGNEHDINSTTFNPETYVQSVGSTGGPVCACVWAAGAARGALNGCALATCPVGACVWRRRRRAGR